MANVNVKQYAACGRSDTSKETTYCFESSLEIIGLGIDKGEALGSTRGCNLVGRLGVVVDEDIQSLDDGQLASIPRIPVCRREVTNQVSDREGIIQFQLHGVVPGIFARFVFALVAIKQLDGVLLDFLSRNESGLEVGHDILLDVAQVGRLQEQSDDLLELPAVCRRSDRQGISIQHKLWRGFQGVVVGPKDEIFPLGAVARTPRERVIEAQTGQTARRGAQERILDLGDLCIGSGCASRGAAVQVLA